MSWRRSGDSRERSTRSFQRSRSRQGRGPTGREELPRSRPVREALPRRRGAPEQVLGTTTAPKRAPRKSKWDDRGDGAATPQVPDWARDLEEAQVAKQVQHPLAVPLGPGPPVSKDSLRRKSMRLQAMQIRVLLGKGGETIKQICEQTNAEIKVDHDRVSDEGDINITGDVFRTEALIRETLAAKGCPMTDEGTPVEDELLQVPGDMVGLFIGRGGEHIKAIREACGGNLYIGVNPPPDGGLHKIQIVGDQREKAREMVLVRLKDMWEAEAKKEAELAAKNQPQPQLSQQTQLPQQMQLPQQTQMPQQPQMPQQAKMPQQPQMPQQAKILQPGKQSNISHLPLAQQAMAKAITAKAPMAPTSSKAPAMQPFPAIPAIPKAPMQANTPTTSSFTTGWSWQQNDWTTWGSTSDVFGDPSRVTNSWQSMQPLQESSNLGWSSSPAPVEVEEAEIDEENPWAGIVPECELPC